MDLNVRKLILFKGERCKKTLNGGSIRWLKMGFLETLGQHKTPFLPLLRSVYRALGGLSYSNIVPVNWYLNLIILCLYMHYLIIVI